MRTLVLSFLRTKVLTTNLFDRKLPITNYDEQTPIFNPNWTAFNFDNLSVGLHGLAVKAAAPNNNKRLIVIFLRGAVDGLNVIVPYQEANYYQSRPKIAIPKPGLQGGAIDLDGRFGLHPALSPIAPLWEQGTLAFAHACGSPRPQPIAL